MSAQDAIAIVLPSADVLARGDHERAQWWRVIDGQVTQQGDDLAWLHPSNGGPLAPETLVLGLAPAADTTLHRLTLPDLAPRQAQVAARLLAAEQSIAPAAELHVVLADAAEDDGARLVAVCANRVMVDWIGWAATHGVELASIVPAALLLPGRADGALSRGTVGDEVIARSLDTAFVADAALIDHIAGAETRIHDVSAAAVEAAMIAACDAPPIELRNGLFARRREPVIDRMLIRRAALLMLAIVGAALLTGIAVIARTAADTARLDAIARADVAKTLNPAPALDAAIPALDARLAALGGGPGRISGPLAGLLLAMDRAPTVTLDMVNWRGDGTLSATLGAPTSNDVNVVLLALQAAGYTITAQPRSGTDGRTLADITMRGAP